MKNSKKRVGYVDEHGFTLVEVLVSMAIFTFGTMALFAMQMRSINTSAQARRLSTATELAQFPIEAFKGSPFKPLDDLCKESGYSTFEQYITTQAPNTFAVYVSPDRLVEKTLTQWHGLFLKEANKENLLKFAGRGTLSIKFERDNMGGSVHTIYADVECKVEWCDNKEDVALCTPTHLHSVTSRQRFNNGI